MFICQTPESAYFLLASVEIKMKVHSVQACLLRVKIEYVASDLLRPGGGAFYGRPNIHCSRYMFFNLLWAAELGVETAPGLEPRSLPKCRRRGLNPGRSQSVGLDVRRPFNSHPTYIKHTSNTTSNIIWSSHPTSSNVHPTYIQRTSNTTSNIDIS